MEEWTLEGPVPLRVWELTPYRDGLPIVCLHGWLDQGMAFQAMAQGRSGRWLGVDQRGFGQSGHMKEGWYHFPNYLGDVDRLVRHLGGRVHLVGHSMGGSVASYYAGARPDQVASLTIIEGLGALASSEPSMLARTSSFLDGLSTPPKSIRVDSLEDAAARLQKRHSGLTPEHAALLAQNGTRQVADRLVWSFDPRHLMKSPYPFFEEEYLAFLQGITAPTLVIFGEDGWFPPAVRDRRLQVLPHAQVEVIPGGHMLVYDAPERVGDLIEAHISEHQP